MAFEGLIAAGIVAYIIFIVIAIVFSIFMFVFWILMIIDAAKRKFKNEGDKVIWLLIIILASWIGSIIYYFVIKRKSDKNKK